MALASSVKSEPTFHQDAQCLGDQVKMRLIDQQCLLVCARCLITEKPMRCLCLSTSTLVRPSNTVFVSLRLQALRLTYDICTQLLQVALPKASVRSEVTMQYVDGATSFVAVYCNGLYCLQLHGRMQGNNKQGAGSQNDDQLFILRHLQSGLRNAVWTANCSLDCVHGQSQPESSVRAADRTTANYGKLPSLSRRPQSCIE